MIVAGVIGIFIRLVKYDFGTNIRMLTLQSMSLACISIICCVLLDSLVGAAIVHGNEQWKKSYPCARIDKNNKKKGVIFESLETDQNTSFRHKKHLYLPRFCKYSINKLIPQKVVPLIFMIEDSIVLQLGLKNKKSKVKKISINDVYRFD